MGLHSSPVSVILPFIKVPSEINVYTIMHPYVCDFGLVGVTFGALFYGLVFSCIYFQASRKHPVYVGIYAFISIGLFSQFFGDVLVQTFSGTIQIIFYTVIVFILSKKQIYVS